MLNGVGIASFGTTVTRLLMLQNNAELRIRNAKKMKEEWQKVKLGEICKITAGGDRPKNVSTKKTNTNKIPIYSNGIDDEGLYGYTDFGTIDGNSITITGRGANVGTVFYRKERYLPIIRLLSLIPNENVINSKYLYYLLKNRKFLSNGAAQPQITVPMISEHEICFIKSLLVQIKIASILSAYDDLIENNRRQIKLLEEAAQRLYKEWFVDLRFPGYEETEIVDGVPEGWLYKRVEEFGEVITGKTPSTVKTEYYGGNIPFITIPDMHEKVFPLVTEKTLTKVGAESQKNKYLPINAVIVSCIATVGLVNIAVKPCQTNQQINSVILHNDNDLYFFYESMKRIKALLDGVGSNGATMTNVNKTKFSNIKVLYPTEDLVLKYNEFCKHIFDKILALSKAMLIAEQARNRLLPKLMSGEIEVLGGTEK